MPFDQPQLDLIVRTVLSAIKGQAPCACRCAAGDRPRRAAALRGLIARTRDIAADVEAALDHIEVLDGER